MALNWFRGVAAGGSVAGRGGAQPRRVNGEAREGPRGASKLFWTSFSFNLKSNLKSFLFHFNLIFIYILIVISYHFDISLTLGFSFQSSHESQAQKQEAALALEELEDQDLIGTQVDATRLNLIEFLLNFLR